MSIDTIVYDKNSHVTGIALIKNNDVREIEIISSNQSIYGNVYLGKITKKVSLAHEKYGFFVNIGTENEAFLNAEEYDMNDGHLVEGQTVVVQVAQERHAEKNARLFRSIQIVGTYLVYCPYRMNVEASSKIENKNTASELLSAVKANITGQEGWVIRTAAETAEINDVLEEMSLLRDSFERIRIKARSEQAPCLLYKKPDSIFEYVNNYYNSGSLRKIITNNHNLEESFKGKNIEFVICNSPFEEYGIDEVIGTALEKEINLKSGGRITIEETRACVAIDVDSGRDNGNGSLNHINNEAAVEIAKQIRLRNLSGKIVIDFAGHSDFRYIKPLLEILEHEMKDDTAKNRIFGLSHGGLVEIVRVRKRPSLQELLTDECRTCSGTGRVEKGE